MNASKLCRALSAVASKLKRIHKPNAIEIETAVVVIITVTCRTFAMN